MTEAMKTLDAGMIAAELEVKASSRALPVTGPACNADGTPAASSAESAVSTVSSAAVASMADPTKCGQPGVDQAAVGPCQGTSSNTAHVAEPDVDSAGRNSTGAGLPQNADRGEAGVAHASQENAANELRTFLSQTNAMPVAITSSSASQTPSTGSTAAGSTSLDVHPVSELVSSAHAAQTYRKEPSLDPAPDGVDGIGKVSAVVAVHADASSSNSSMQTAPAQPTASAESQASGSNNQLAPVLAHQQPVQGTASPQFSTTRPLSQPVAAQQAEQAYPQVQASASSQAASGSNAAQQQPLHQGTSAVLQPSPGDAAAPQQLPAATAQPGTAAADKDPAAVQQSAGSGGADVSQTRPAWFAEEGHVALMLQDFLVSHCTSASRHNGYFGLVCTSCFPNGMVRKLMNDTGTSVDISVQGS